MKGYLKVLMYLLLFLALPATNVMAQTTAAEPCKLPPADILGKDIEGFPRYPNSIRVRFSKETEKNIITLGQRVKGMEVNYRSSDAMSSILEFYNSRLTESGWELYSSNYMGETTVQMVFSRGETQILFSIRPHTMGIRLSRNTNVTGQQPQPTPADCYVIQVFAWDKKDAETLERRTRPPDDQRQPSRTYGR